MPKFDRTIFRSDLISVVEHIRDLCSAKVPLSLGHYTGSQLRMITRIYELTRNSSDGLQLKTLAKVLHITPAATSEMVETLVKRGALERRIAANDRRAMSLRLSRELENCFPLRRSPSGNHPRRFLYANLSGRKRYHRQYHRTFK